MLILLGPRQARTTWKGCCDSVLLELSLPLINPHMVHASIDAVLVRLDSRIAVGETIMELTVDLSDQFPHQS